MEPTQFTWGEGDYWLLRERNYGVYSEAEQRRISQARVCVVGLGCVGELEAVMLARIGVGEIVLVDFDKLELTNLNRNPFSTRSMIGKEKVHNMARYLRAIDHSIKVFPRNTRFSFSNGRDIVQGCQVILQAVDQMVSRIVIHRVARRIGIPCVTMSGAPRFRLFVTTILPDGESYESFLSLPTKDLSDQDLCSDGTMNKINELRRERAKCALKKGAGKEWAKLYASGKRQTWAVTPERPYLTAVLSVRETMKIILGENPVCPPRLIAGDLDDCEYPVQTVDMGTPKKWTFADF